jgi:energy-converting hydrogenase Eha subunit C
MWRVGLSVAAVAFDAAALIMILLAFVGVLFPEASAAGGDASATSGEPASNPLVMIIVLAALAAGIVVNIAAVAFGARLKGRRTAREVAADFS